MKVIVDMIVFTIAQILLIRLSTLAETDRKLLLKIAIDNCSSKWFFLENLQNLHRPFLLKIKLRRIGFPTNFVKSIRAPFYWIHPGDCYY